jgi:hypothetical protein
MTVLAHLITLFHTDVPVSVTVPAQISWYSWISFFPIPSNGTIIKHLTFAKQDITFQCGFSPYPSNDSNWVFPKRLNCMKRFPKSQQFLRGDRLPWRFSLLLNSSQLFLSLYPTHLHLSQHIPCAHRRTTLHWHIQENLNPQINKN